MHRHGSPERILLHESKGEAWCRLHVTVIRFKCPHCGRTHLQRLPYEVNGHRITTPDCSVKMHRHGSKERILLHESKGEAWCRLHVTVIRFKCPHCGRTHLPRLPYEVNGHRITTSLEQQVLKLLKANNTSHKMIAAQTGLNAHAIKEIRRTNRP